MSDKKEQEKWTPVSGYEGYFEKTASGKARQINSFDVNGGLKANQIPYIDDDGYLKVRCV